MGVFVDVLDTNAIYGVDNFEGILDSGQYALYDLVDVLWYLKKRCGDKEVSQIIFSFL